MCFVSQMLDFEWTDAGSKWIISMAHRTGSDNILFKIDGRVAGARPNRLPRLNAVIEGL